MKSTEEILNHINKEITHVSSKIEIVKGKLSKYGDYQKEYFPALVYEEVQQLEIELREEGTKFLLLTNLKQFIES